MTGCDGICYLVAAAYVNCPLIGEGRCGRSIVFFRWSCGCCRSGGQHEQHHWQHRQNPAGCRRHPLLLLLPVPIHLQKRFRLNWGETFTHTHKLPHVATRWQPRKNTKEEAVIEETLWLGRGFIQGHKVSIVFLLLYLCVCVAKIQWQRNNLKKKYDSFKVRLRQVALVHRVCRHEIGHATSEKEVGKFHELVEHSLLFFPMAFVCCDTCTALEVLFFLFTLAFLLPFGFLPFWLLFSTSFHLLLCFYLFFLPSFFNTHATSFYFSLGLLDRPSSTKKKERYQEENTSKKVVYLCVCCCCWK